MIKDTKDKKTLKTRFRAAAQNSKALRFLFNHGARISSAGYLTGNAIMLFKQGVDVNWDTAAGALFVANGFALWASKNHPWLLRVGGLCTIAGSLAMIAAGIGTPALGSRIMGVAPVLLAGTLMTRENGNPQPRNIAEKYPVLGAGALMLAGRPFLIASAFANGAVDWGLIATALSWSVADHGLMATDKNLQKALKIDGGNKNQPSAPALPQPV